MYKQLEKLTPGKLYKIKHSDSMSAISYTIVNSNYSPS